ncbi:MAG: hypothetical protein V1838_05530 [Patescibacteria group bacterium]
MKTITVVIFSLLFIVAALPSSAVMPLSISDELLTDLQQFKSDPFLVNYVLTVLDSLPTYDRLFIKAAKIAAGLHIDIILQEHSVLQPNQSGSLVPYVDGNIRHSQQKIKELLLSRQYNVIGYEGIDIDPLDYEALVAFTQRIARDTFGKRVSRQEAKEILKLPSDDAVIELIKAGQLKSPVIGLEAYELNLLEMKAMGLMDLPSTQLRYYALENFCRHLGQLRAAIGVSKLIIKLDKLGKTKAAMVIGSAHQSELDLICRQLKLPHTFIDTTKK